MGELRSGMARLGVVGIVLVHHRDDVAQYALAELDRHGLTPATRASRSARARHTALVLAPAATPARLVAARRPRPPDVTLLLLLGERRARATISRLMALLIAPRRVAIQIDRDDHERAVAVRATLAQAPLHPRSAFLEWLIVVEPVDPARPPFAGNPIVLVGQPDDRRRSSPHGDPSPPRGGTKLRPPLLFAHRRPRAERLHLALELVQLPPGAPQATRRASDICSAMCSGSSRPIANRNPSASHSIASSSRPTSPYAMPPAFNVHIPPASFARNSAHKASTSFMSTGEEKDPRDLASPIRDDVPPQLKRPLRRRDRLVVSAATRKRKADVLQHARHQPARHIWIGGPLLDQRLRLPEATGGPQGRLELALGRVTSRKHWKPRRSPSQPRTDRRRRKPIAALKRDWAGRDGMA
jgi:hypothetical protein